MKTIRGRFRAAMLMGTAASVLAFAPGAKAQNTWPYAPTGSSPVIAVVGDIACQPGETELPGEKANENCAASTTPQDLQGTGAIPQNLYASQAATANQIENLKPDLVVLVGDEQYQVGQYSDFENSYETTYGAFKFITRPSPGNHEFYTEHGAVGVAGYGYFSYFNGVQHNSDGSIMTATISGIPDTNGTFTQPVPFSDGQAGHFEQTGGLGTNTGGGPVGVGDGWYSYNLGAWHLISLNIECETQPGGCSSTGSWLASELEWLRSDLAANQSPCTLAYWHQPSFSAVGAVTLPEGQSALAFWKLLYRYGADLVLNGHDHLYARYRPLDAAGSYSPKTGIREFIVGTGGETLDTVVYTTTLPSTDGADAADLTGQPNFNLENIEAATGQFWGVMALTLNENGYAWDFESTLKDPAQTTGPFSFSDKGVGTCHGHPNVASTESAISPF
jgi:acid phosphatase type 7